MGTTSRKPTSTRTKAKPKRQFMVRSLDIEARVRAGLSERRGAWGIVEDRTGVASDWIRQYMAGRIAEPGFHKMVALATYLDISMEVVAKP